VLVVTFASGRGAWWLATEGTAPSGTRCGRARWGREGPALRPQRRAHRRPGASRRLYRLVRRKDYLAADPPSATGYDTSRQASRLARHIWARRRPDAVPPLPRRRPHPRPNGPNSPAPSTCMRMASSRPSTPGFAATPTPTASRPRSTTSVRTARVRWPRTAGNRPSPAALPMHSIDSPGSRQPWPKGPTRGLERRGPDRPHPSPHRPRPAQQRNPGGPQPRGTRSRSSATCPCWPASCPGQSRPPRPTFPATWGPASPTTSRAET